MEIKPSDTPKVTTVTHQVSHLDGSVDKKHNDFLLWALRPLQLFSSPVLPVQCSEMFYCTILILLSAVFKVHVTGLT